MSLLISVILFQSLNFFFFQKFKIDFNPTSIFNQKTIQIKIQANEMVENEIKQETKEQSLTTKEIWKISIPCILLEASIAEGTEENILNSYVGHFENTSKIQGNIGLAAHNRGYPVNYFKNLKKLKKGDEIIYQYQEQMKMYEVIENKIIEDTDWSYLEKKEENLITLITCVENEPEYRRCIQGKEKK